MNLIPGQNGAYKVTPSDVFGNDTVAIMTTKLQQCPTLELNKQDVYVFDGKLVKTNLYLRGLKVINTTLDRCILKFCTMSNPVICFIIKLHVSKCNLGFVNVNQDKWWWCKCFYQIPGVSCKTTSATAYIEKGLWYGYLHTDHHNDSQPVVHTCPSNRCDYSKCQRRANSSLHGHICKLPTLVENQDQQCLHNRGGLYCSQCNKHAVFTYGASLCIPKEQCNLGSNIILACLYLLCMAIIIVVFLAVLKMGFKVGSGYLYAFVYYFTVVPYFLISSELFNVLYLYEICSGLIFLNPKFLGLIPICSIPSLKRLHHEALHYLDPLFIFSALLCLSCIAKHKPRLIRPGKFIIHGICTLILLTFTSLSKTSTSILDSVTFYSNMYVGIQPDIPYFDVKQHLPFACLALFVMLFLLIPFTVLLLFEPLIVRCVNLIRIRPFLDDFQACFCDNRRWMAGFYFLARLLIFFFVPLNPKTSQLLIKMVNICILFIVVVLQPYRKKHLNLIDALLMLNLCIVGLLSNYVELLPARIALLLLILIAALYGVVLFIWAVIRTIRRHTKWKYLHLASYKQLGRELHNFVSSVKKDEDTSDTDGILHVEITRSRQEYNPQALREELLSYEEKSLSAQQ